MILLPLKFKYRDPANVPVRGHKADGGNGRIPGRRPRKKVQAHGYQGLGPRRRIGLGGVGR